MSASTGSRERAPLLSSQYNQVSRYDSADTLIPAAGSGSLESSTSSSTSITGYQEIVGNHSNSFSWALFRQETMVLSRLTYPVILAYLLQYSINVASVFSLGHLGSDELAASALASMLAAVSGWAVGIGLVTALDTLCSQSFTGARDKHAVGTYLQRGLLATAACHIPIVAIWLWSEPLLLALKQDPIIAHFAGLYLRYLTLGCLPNLWFECVKRYLQAQGIMHASTLVLCIVAPVNMFTNYALVWWKPISLGFIGAPLATAFSYWLMFALLVLYTIYVDGYQAWGGWSRQAFYKLDEFMRLGLPGIITTCAEWWAFEVVALIVSYLGNVPLAAQSVILTTSAFTFQIPQGIGVSCSNRVGNLLGAGQAQHARIAGMVAMTFAAVLGTLCSLFFITVGSWWGHVFTDSLPVIELVAQLMKIGAIYQICDGVSTVIGGILRGQGRQKISAMLMLIAYYVVALPLGIFCGFYLEMGIVGIWTGLCIGIFFSCFVQIGVFIRTDWNYEVHRCQKLVGDEGAEFLAPPLP
ncbi:ethionine resistance protein [Dispira simplex]|nr:ethionine resistance protein [Dispira simplex]